MPRTASNEVALARRRYDALVARAPRIPAAAWQGLADRLNHLASLSEGGAAMRLQALAIDAQLRGNRALKAALKAVA